MTESFLIKLQASGLCKICAKFLRTLFLMELLQETASGFESTAKKVISSNR